MRSSLSVYPSPPTTLGGIDGITVIPDTRYFVCHQLDAGMTLYPGQYLVHGAPSQPPPANATVVLKDGSVDWHWLDLLATALTAGYYLYATWNEGAVWKRGTMQAKLLRGVAVTTSLTSNDPAHMWAGDTP